MDNITTELSESQRNSRAAAPPPRRIPELDGLRGMAILLVILGHYVGNVEHAQLGPVPHRLLQLFSLGWSGVDLFFVLSGFLIGGILLDARQSPHYFRAFYMRRIFRILPVYYAWTLLYAVIVAAILIFFPGRFSVVPRDFLRVPIQLLFLQNIFIGMPPFMWMWFVVTWSLAVEEQFYLLAPPLIRFLSVRRLVTVLASMIVIAPLLRFAFFRYWAPDSFAAAFLMPCRADSLSWGILLALAWRQEWFHVYLKQHPSRLRAILGMLLLGVIGLGWWFLHALNVITATIGYTVLGMVYSCLLVLVMSQKDSWIAGFTRWKWLGALGTISYCVYIVHLTFNLLGHELFFQAGPQIYTVKGVGVTMGALVLSLLVASLSWRYFEKPLVRRGHGYSYEET